MSWRAVRWTLVAALVVGALVVWRRPAQQQLVIRYGPPAYTCGPAPARPALRFAMITVLPNGAQSSHAPPPTVTLFGRGR